MKKILFSMIAVAAMTSCSQSEDAIEAVPVAPTPIAFAPQMGNTVATRADIALANTVSLGVFAFNGTPTATIYDGIEDMRLRYVTASSGWFLNPAEHYYPADGTEVDFWAYGPKGNTHLSGIDCDAANGPTFTLTLGSTDIGPTAVDIFSTQTKATGKLSTASTAVAFTLKHLLAQVKFEAKTNNQASADNYDVKIYDIAIETKAEAVYANKVWETPSGSVVTWRPVDEDDTQAILTATAASVGELVSLIPGQETTITVKARVYKKNQSFMVTEQVVSITLDNTSGKEYLEPGKSYTYAITVEPKVGRITFDAPQITDWTPATGDIAVPQPAP